MHTVVAPSCVFFCINSPGSCDVWLRKQLQRQPSSTPPLLTHAKVGKKLFVWSFRTFGASESFPRGTFLLHPRVLKRTKEALLGSKCRWNLLCRLLPLFLEARRQPARVVHKVPNRRSLYFKTGQHACTAPFIGANHPGLAPLLSAGANKITRVLSLFSCSYGRETAPPYQNKGTGQTQGQKQIYINLQIITVLDLYSIPPSNS